MCQHRVLGENNITQEYRIRTAALGLVCNYFPIKEYAISPPPKQIHDFTRKKPDLAI